MGGGKPMMLIVALSPEFELDLKDILRHFAVEDLGH